MKLKKTIIIPFIVILCLIIIGGVFHYMKNTPNNSAVKDEENSLLNIEHFDDKISIKNFDVTQGIVFKGDTVKAVVSIENLDKKEEEIWLGYSLQDDVGKWYDVEPKSIKIPAKKSSEYDIEWIIPEDVLTGDYTIVLGLWDKTPDLSSRRLASATLKDSLRIYNSRENFDFWLENEWLANDSKLGRSTLQSKNVILNDGILKLKLPGETLYGAEIQRKEKVHYGSYEIRMKLPDAPSSITGFFLYDQPDYYHEIDIEIYNQVEADLLLTTYAKGKKVHAYQQPLSFDPTSDFHSYRINYLPEKVEFMIDDILIQTWSNGFTAEPMYLMVNTWYPKWLEGIPPDKDQYLLIDWILK